MTCPTCGIDHHAEQAEAVADAIVEAAEADAAASVDRSEAMAEAEADANDTREHIAEIEAEAAVAIAEAQAEAAVAIAEADAAADVDIAAMESSPPEEPVLESEEPVIDEAPAEDAEPDVTGVDIPPQLEDDPPTPTTRGTRKAVKVTRFQAHRVRR